MGWSINMLTGVVAGMILSHDDLKSIQTLPKY